LINDYNIYINFFIKRNYRNANQNECDHKGQNIFKMVILSLRFFIIDTILSFAFYDFWIKYFQCKSMFIVSKVCMLQILLLTIDSE